MTDTPSNRRSIDQVSRTLYDHITERMRLSMPKARPSNWPNPTVQTLPDQVAEAILQRIATGELPPGHRLPAQRELAQSMGVGLAVIREAVQRLATLNIVEAAHGSGTIIRPFRWLPLLYDKSLFHLAMQRIGIHDLWEARRLLEGQIIRLAVQRRTELDLERMRDVLDAAKPLPETYGQSQTLNLKFHRAIASATTIAVGRGRLTRRSIVPSCIATWRRQSGRSIGTLRSDRLRSMKL